jgi:hypothetical protein
MKMNKCALLVGLLAIGYSTFGQSAQSNTYSGEEAAIRKVIETETKAFHEANFNLQKQQWSTSPYTERQHVELKSYVGMPFIKGEKLIQLQDAYAKTAKPTGYHTSLTDYESHVSGTTAWVTYTQETMNNTGSVIDTQRAVRILERSPDGWKIVFMSQQKI